MALRIVRYRPSDLEDAEITMNWSSIFSGAFLTLGFGLFFIFLGNAVGLNVLNTARTDISGALKFWSWIYVAATLIFSYFLGGLLSTRSTSIDTPTSGVVHGLTSWGLSSFLFIGVAAISSIGTRILISGLAGNSANWLAVCIVGLGGVAAAMGGVAGKYSKERELRREEGLEGRRVA